MRSLVFLFCVVAFGTGCLLPFDPGLLDSGQDSGAPGRDAGVDAGTPPTFVGGRTAKSATATATLKPPVGSQEGDLLLAWLFMVPAPAPQTGWSQLGSSHVGKSGSTEGHVWLGYRVLAAGETEADFSLTASSGNTELIFLSFRGVKPTDPVPVFALNESYVTPTTNMVTHFTPALSNVPRPSLGVFAFAAPNPVPMPTFADAGIATGASLAGFATYVTEQPLAPGASLPRLSLTLDDISGFPERQWVAVGAVVVTGR